MREIFRKVPMSEKKALFRKGSEEKMVFFAKGELDELVTLLLDEYVDGKVLTFNYAAQSPIFLENQKIVLNFSNGEDRYFAHATAEVFTNRVHVAATSDVYILQRRKSPRLDIPDAYPSWLNIISHEKKAVMYQCKLLDFSSGGCRVQYAGHLPLFKSGEVVRAVLHLNHRNPIEFDYEVKHHIFDKAAGLQVFGMQFKLNSTILENKMLVVFMDLQRELFIKWNDGENR